MRVPHSRNTITPCCSVNVGLAGGLDSVQHLTGVTAAGVQFPPRLPPPGSRLRQTTTELWWFWTSGSSELGLNCLFLSLFIWQSQRCCSLRYFLWNTRTVALKLIFSQFSHLKHKNTSSFILLVIFQTLRVLRRHNTEENLDSSGTLSLPAQNQSSQVMET